MFFQLLQGLYQDAEGRTYRVEQVRDQDGKVVQEILPTIETNSDLISSFGSQKFRRLPDNEANNLVPKENGMGADPDVSGGSAHGDVTCNFPKAAQAGLKVYRQADGSYFVSDAHTNDVLNAGESLKSRVAVNKFIKKYLEA